MTVENCLKLLKAYGEKVNDTSLPSHIREQSKKNFENMKKHIAESKKFKTLKPLKEVKDGKESKGRTDKSGDS